VLEIHVDQVEDSDSTLTTLSNVDVLVRFAKPHRLCQLTDLVGACSAIEPVGETSIALKDLATTEVIEIGDELHIADMRLYPGMEAATADGDVVTFTQSTLKPNHEELFCHLVVARAVLSDNINYINAINKGGPNTWANYQSWGERKLAMVLGNLKGIAKPRSKGVYSRR